MQEIHSLPLLQNRIKKSPVSYRNDYLIQYRSFQAQLALFELTPNKDSSLFARLCEFISQVCHLYKDDVEDSKKIGRDMMRLLLKHCDAMEANLRRTLLQCLVLMRRRGGSGSNSGGGNSGTNGSLVDCEEMIECCFQLFQCKDKLLREMLHYHIVNDIRVINLESNQTKLNKSLQNLVYSMMISVNDPNFSTTALSSVWNKNSSAQQQVVVANTTQAKKSLSVIIELYRKRIWTDARTVNVIASACFSTITRNAVVAMQFFLGIDVEIDRLQEEANDDELTNAIQVTTTSDKVSKDKEAAREVLRAGKRAMRNFSKKTRAKDKKKEKEKHAIKKAREKLHGLSQTHDHPTGGVTVSAEERRLTAPRFPAIEMINDPQGFAERLFKKLQASTEHFEVRMMTMDLLSRVVGWHKLILLPFYTYLQRYMQPHQENVTSILAYLIQASHEMVPPDELESTVKILANNFINDRTNPEVIAVGINSINELIKKVPLLTDVEDMDGLIADLVEYKTYRNGKSVVTAARTMLNTMREINPTVLQRKLRGKDHDPASKPVEYGHVKVSTGIEGADLLADEEDEENGEFEEADDDDDGEDEDEDEEDDDEDEEDDDEDEEIQATNGHGDKRESKSVVSTTSSKKSRDGKPIEGTRILTQEDFDKIRVLKRKHEKIKARKMEEKTKEPAKKKPKFAGGLLEVVGGDGDDGMEGSMEEDDDVSVTDDSGEDDDDHDDVEIDPMSLQGVVKRKQIELKNRLEEAYTAKEASKKKERSGGLTNDQQKKNKNFLMVSRSRNVQMKQRETLFEQRKKVKDHLKKLDVKKKTIQKIKRKMKR